MLRNDLSLNENLNNIQDIVFPSFRIRCKCFNFFTDYFFSRHHYGYS